MHSDVKSSNQPHMVMAVGNAALGDSRVEKAAISAREAGYKVTVVAIQRKNTQPFGFIDKDIPILRLPIGRRHHTDKIREQVRPLQVKARDLKQAVSAQSHVVAALKTEMENSDFRWHERMQFKLRLTEAERKLEKLISSMETLDAEEIARILKRYPNDSQWAETWPEIADYRDVFYAGFRQLNPDLIHVHDIHPMAGANAYCEEVAQQGKDVRWVYDAHEWLPGQDFYKFPPARHLGWSKMERDLAPKAAKVLTVSEKMAEQLQKRLALRELPGVVYNAPMLSRINTPLAPRKPIREECNVPEGTPIMVYVGGVDPRRGTLTMVDAVVLHPNVHAVFVANKDLVSRSAIIKRAEEQGVSDRVHIREYVPADSVCAYIRSADVGVSPLLPTAAHHQAAPTKVREYMLADLPVVVSDMQVQGEMVNRLKIGEVFPAGDAAALTEAVTKCLENRDKYVGNYTQELLRENSWDVCMPALVGAWDHLHPSPKQSSTEVSPEQQVWVDISDSSAYVPLVEELKKVTGYRVHFSLPQLCHPLPTPVTDNYFATEGARPAIDFWREEFSNLHGIVSDKVHRWIAGMPDSEINRSLKSLRTRNIVLSEDSGADDLSYASNSFADHKCHDLSEPEWAYVRTTNSERRMADLTNGHYVASASPLTARSYRSAGLYLPFPVEQVLEEIPERAHEARIRVGILTAERSAADHAAIADLLAESNKNLEAVVVNESADAAELSGFDIVVDSLGVDFHGRQGAVAMAQGAAIMTGRHAKKSYKHQISALPSLRARPVELIKVLSNLTRAEVDDKRRQCLEYAREHYLASKVVEELLAIMNADSV